MLTVYCLELEHNEEKLQEILNNNVKNPALVYYI